MREVQALQLPPAHGLLADLISRQMLLRSAYTHEALARLVARSRFGTGEIVLEGIGFDLRLVEPREA